MPKAKRVPPELSDDEEACIQAGIAVDPENPEWTDSDFARAKPSVEALPAELYAALARPRGRPKADETKIPIKLRLDRAAVEAFKATGDGWQTRMNDTLVAAAKRLPDPSTAPHVQRRRSQRTPSR